MGSDFNFDYHVSSSRERKRARVQLPRGGRDENETGGMAWLHRRDEYPH